MTVVIRSATAADQPAITALVRGAGINPSRLAWPNFVVAEDGGIVGAAQIRPYPDGGRELASLVVAKERRGEGIATRMIEELMRREPDAVYTMVGRDYLAHFGRFGFLPAARRPAPPGIRRQFDIGRVVTWAASPFMRKPVRLMLLIRPFRFED
jgi:N-acetylglutamate synthase-like GNAT family acetyltransferase